MTNLLSPLMTTLSNAINGEGPRYQQLAQSLRSAIQEGTIGVGGSIPPERELAQHLQVSRVTVRKAIESLVQEGLLEVRHGSGTFVSARLEQPLSVLASFSQDMIQRNFVPGSIWLSREVARPTTAETVSLGLSASESVVHIVRVRTANGQPMAVERATVSVASVGGSCDFGESLYAALQRHGTLPTRALQVLRADIATNEEAELLGVPHGSAVLRTERRSFSQEGKPVELTHSIYRGDKYDYLVELRTVTPRQEENK